MATRTSGGGGSGGGIHMNNHIYVDRSRLETKQHCPREYYWQYMYHNRGIVVKREIPPPWALMTGSYVHSGIERLLAPYGEHPNVVALGYAERYITEIKPLFNDIEESPAKDNLIHTLNEQSQLVTALIYGWYKIIYPNYIATYEPVDIEREEAITFQVGDNELTLLTRTDLLSKIRGSDNYVIHNWKTVGDANKGWLDQWRYDQQTLTEYIAAESRIGKTIVGTIIVGLVKGRKSEWPEDSGNWSHNNPMIYQWIKDNGGEIDYQAKYKWKCDSPHQMSKGKECPGGQNHTRSGYFKGAVADKYPGGIIGWIDHLVETEPESLSPYFITLPPISRSDWEIERWKRQTLMREIDDVTHAREIDRLIAIEPDTAAILLDYYFPMATGHGNCHHFGHPCGYLDVCFGAADVDDDSKFKPREWNHPMEGRQ